MATTFTVNLKISNPNKVKSKALITHLSDSSVEKSVEIDGGKDTTVAVQTTEYKGTLDVLFSANGFNNSESSTINYEYNPTDNVNLNYSLVTDYTNSKVIAGISLKNNSNYNLVFKKSASHAYVTIRGFPTKEFSYDSTDDDDVEFNRTESISPYNDLALLVDSSVGDIGKYYYVESLYIILCVEWVLDGVTKTSKGAING